MPSSYCLIIDITYNATPINSYPGQLLPCAVTIKVCPTVADTVYNVSVYEPDAPEIAARVQVPDTLVYDTPR